MRYVRFMSVNEKESSKEEKKHYVSKRRKNDNGSAKV